MQDFEIALPLSPKIILEEGKKGIYEIDGLYAGYGHTLGNSLRRIILSSIPGAAITTVKIEGVSHEFSTISGIKEDVIVLLLNLKQVRFNMDSGAPLKATLNIKGQKVVTAGDFETPAGLEVLNKDRVIATLTDKNSHLSLEVDVEKGLGYVPREVLKKDKIETGMIILDAVFTPVRRVNYEVENMRVGDRTDYNRLRFIIETDGSITPRFALENSIKILLKQLSAIVGFSEEDTNKMMEEVKSKQPGAELKKSKKDNQEKTGEDSFEGEELSSEDDSQADFLKTRIEDLGLSNRTLNSLSKASIRTAGGLARKKADDLKEIEGLGEKGINEIRRALGNLGLILK
ncbi:MAG: DNA-directed RNA polymerase subunit alpha [Candidatus Pacebacteria bacterium]|nr:DNA-directed RNA polymerase subunit alpha [Candidatus Paceibacterota bacterium]